jgi:hypothetical protein
LVFGSLRVFVPKLSEVDIDEEEKLRGIVGGANDDAELLEFINYNNYNIYKIGK